MNYKSFLHAFVLVFFFVVFNPLLPKALAAWSGQVVGVADGDTIAVIHELEKVKIRLYGIDTPEKKQVFGNKARRYTNATVRKKSVEIVPIERDRYGRTVAMVFVAGECLNEALVRDGYAWVYRQYCKKEFCRDWLKLESTARENRQGLWLDRNPTPPWEWRKESRKKKDWWGRVLR